MLRYVIMFGMICGTLTVASSNKELTAADVVAFRLTDQQESSPGTGRYHRLTRREDWPAERTAVIVCDMWDLHHSRNATRRVEQLAPRLDQFLTEARRRGMTIIHAPSDCMAAYEDHPARRRAQSVPLADPLPAGIEAWCSVIPTEQRAAYPLDQSDGGDEDDPAEHQAWAAQLAQQGRDPSLPWKRQTDLITIDSARDFVSDRGEEVWSILQQHGIEHVILTGVHTNMCVLGRPFGLRQMVRHGKRVVLVRDLTDTMYNPARWPHVNHFTGNDLIVSHIERFVCPTITSNQLLGGTPFRFPQDTRPHIAIVMADDEYETERTLPRFAAEQLGRDYRVSLVFGSDAQRHQLPGLDVLADADLAVISVRRRVPPRADLEIMRAFVAAGKPMVGVRTASHAFSLRDAAPPEGHADWPEFDAQVWGGNYHGHHANDLCSNVSIVPDAAEHPVLRGLSREAFMQGGSLYKTSPLHDGTTVLMTGRAEGQPPEPVAWTFMRQDGGRSFYTSLGHPDDFQHPQFVRLLRNGIDWALGKSPANGVVDVLTDASHDWIVTSLPAERGQDEADSAADSERPVWYRCALRLGPPRQGTRNEPLTLVVPGADARTRVWLNGHAAATEDGGDGARRFQWNREALLPNDLSLLVIRYAAASQVPHDVAPRIVAGPLEMTLNGRWQKRIGDAPGWSMMPLPARYGAPTDIVFQP